VYGGVFIAACAIYPAFPGLITWLCNNLAGSYKRSAGMAIQIGIGNLAGVRTHSSLLDLTQSQAMASNFYRAKDGPRFVLGHALELGFIIAGIVACIILMASYTAVNKKREKQMRGGEKSVLSNEELSTMGDRAVTFRYML
jgi:hypothetical protein